MTFNNETAENWGYILIEEASRNLIYILEGQDSLNNYTTSNDQDERAREIIFTILGVEPCLFYVRRFKVDQIFPDQKEIWTLTLGTDNNISYFSEELNSFANLREKTLQFRATIYKNNTGCLAIYRINFVDIEEAKEDAFCLPFYINLLPDSESNIGIPVESSEQIQALQFYQNYVLTNTQPRLWEEYLNIEERLAENKQFCVEFLMFSYSNSIRRITFQLHAPPSAFGVRSSHVSSELTEETFWERVKNTGNKDIIELITATEQVKHKNSGIVLGKIETFSSDSKDIRIEITPEQFNDIQANFPLTESGFLLFKNVRGLTQIKWKKQALTNLKQGYVQNINLRNFFFDAAQARPVEEVSLHQDDLLLREANSGQIAAVKAALGAEDLVLLQGPPGTGKTTVIAEICYQIAKIGGRTLIVSQANLAVDNALDRLRHHHLLRPLRKGNIDSIDIEGQRFLEDNVIHDWRKNTAKDCKNQLSEKQRTVEILKPLLTSLERFTVYISKEENFPQEQQELAEAREALDAEYEIYNRNYETAQAKQQELEALIRGLQNLIKSEALFKANKQQEIQDLRKQTYDINLAINQLKQCLYSANSSIYITFKKYLQERRKINCIEILNLLPFILLDIQAKRNDFFLSDSFNQYINEFNQIVDKYCEQDETDKIANSIYWMIFQRQSFFNQVNISKANIKKLFQKIQDKIKNLPSLDAVNYLYQVLQTVIIRQESNGQEQLNLADYLVAIKRSLELILQQIQTLKKETTLYRITANIASILINEGLDYLVGIDTEIQERIKVIEADKEERESTLIPLAIVENVVTYLSSNLKNICDDIKTIEINLKEITHQLEQVKAQIKELNNSLEIERIWWRNIWINISNYFGLENELTLIFTPEFLQRIPNYFESWRQKRKEAEFYLQRYQLIMERWIERLLNPSETDLAQLKQQYLDNVNIVGITCVSAANWKFSQEFNQFDVVIVDEVSKCTPPELLIPAIKGKKLVMIGDYCQLPPILNEENLDELAEAIDVPIEILNFWKNLGSAVNLKQQVRLELI